MELHFLHFLERILSRYLTFLAFTMTEFNCWLSSAFASIPLLVLTLFNMDSYVFLSSSFCCLQFLLSSLFMSMLYVPSITKTLILSHSYCYSHCYRSRPKYCQHQSASHRCFPHSIKSSGFTSEPDSVLGVVAKGLVPHSLWVMCLVLSSCISNGQRLS